jgi:hypothetical protein
MFTTVFVATAGALPTMLPVLHAARADLFRSRRLRHPGRARVTPRSAISLVLRDGLMLTTRNVALQIVAAAIGARLLARVLFGIAYSIR